MSFVADLHNFGRQVVPVERASGRYFRKPRPLFWEWLFFGATSPLRPSFEVSRHSCAEKIANVIFNLEIEFDQDLTGGLSREIASLEQVAAPSHEELYSFGALLGYCYIFGISDLHKFNLVRSSTHLQVIDAEVVLTNLLLPNQTRLLPYKATTFLKSALHHLFDSPDDVPTKHVESLLSGFTATFEIIDQQSDLVRKVFNSVAEKTKSVPIRYIMRDTALYKRFPNIPADTGLIKEELVQLNRGDVPYFFKFVGDRNLYYYTTPDWVYGTVDVPEKFQDSINKTGVDPVILIDPIRLQKLLATGTLFLAKQFLSKDLVVTFSLSRTTLLATDSERLILRTTHGSFQAARHSN